MQLNIKKITEFNGQLDSVLDQCKTTLDNSTNHAQAISKESIREISQEFQKERNACKELLKEKKILLKMIAK